MTIDVLIVEDHHVVREGLRMVLELDPALQVVGEAANGSEAIALAQQLHPDLVLMDLMLPEVDGIIATSAIRKELPETEVLILTSTLTGASITGAIRAGAIGYLLKDAQATDLRAAIKAAAAGQVQLAPEASAYLMRELRDTEQPDQLTERESDVLLLLTQGRSNREIATTLHIVEDTVKTHVRHILNKLGVQSRTQAVLMAMRLGLVSSHHSPQ